MRATLKRTLLIGSKLGTILVVMALGVGIGLGFSTLAHPPEAGDFDFIHACVNDTTGQVLMPAAIQPPTDTACPAGWTAAHWPDRVTASQGTVSESFAVAAGATETHDIACADPNDAVISGGVGAVLIANSGVFQMRQSFPLTSTSWRVTVENTDAVNAHDALASIICAPDPN